MEGIGRTVFGYEIRFATLPPLSLKPMLMSRRLSSLLACAALLAACSSEPKSASAPEEPGLLGRMWESTARLNPLKSSLKPREMKQARPLNLKSLVVTLSVEPPAPKLAEVRQMTVTMRLVNRGKKLIRLDFPTTQRIDVVVKNTAGKAIEHWSDDRRFENQPGLVTINPGERLEYQALVATREMTAGETFTVEAWFPAYDSLNASAPVTPVK